MVGQPKFLGTGKVRHEGVRGKKRSREKAGSMVSEEPGCLGGTRAPAETGSLLWWETARVGTVWRARFIDSFVHSSNQAKNVSIKGYLLVMVYAKC